MPRKKQIALLQSTYYGGFFQDGTSGSVSRRNISEWLVHPAQPIRVPGIGSQGIKFLVDLTCFLSKRRLVAKNEFSKSCRLLSKSLPMKPVNPP
jgi:hypothetical protein